MFRILFLLFFLLSASAFGQDEAIDWINKNACELKLNSTPKNDDLVFLSKEIRGRAVVGLGEASHGTREFYLQKSRMIEYLINRYDFKHLSFELPDSYMIPINQYLQSGRGNLKEHMRPIALYNTEEIYKLFKWIREYNNNRSAKKKVQLIGVDNEEFWANPLTRDRLMAENIIKSYQSKKRKTIVWAHNLHIAKDTTMANMPAMGSYLEEHFGKKFYAVGFDTYEGAVNVLENGNFKVHTFEGVEKSLSNTFSKAKYNAFFLSFKPGPFTGTTGLITNIYSNWQVPKPLPIRPGLDFDGIVFIRKTSASIRLTL
ncbi:MAG TPA: erythromycin esterase family protein [Flavobacterium sp.]